MIEVDETRLSYYRDCIRRERLAAEASKTDEARLIHIRLMQQYEQKISALQPLGFRSKS